jgi:hypothetical protein
VRIKRLRKHTLQAIELGKTMNLSADELDIWNGRLRSVDLLLASAFYKLQVIINHQ